MPPTTTTNKNTLSIPLAIVCAGAMIAVSIYAVGAKNTSNLGANNPTPIKTDVQPITSEDRLLGNPEAEVIVVEYSDLECPFCKIFHSTMHEVINAYDGKVAWVYRHFPIVELHPKALKEAEASECAAEQGGNTAFWKYIDQVFATTEANNSLDPAELPRIASSLGLSVESFNECLSSGRYTEKIKQSVNDAVASGARGTPFSIIIKGKDQVIINGAESFADVKAKIDSVL